MSKTIDLQLQKSETLIDALRRRFADVADKGITMGQLDEMQRQLAQLQENAKAVADLRSRLTAQVKKTNDLLAACKRAYAETKTVVRDNFLQDDWAKYGVLDKR